MPEAPQASAYVVYTPNPSALKRDSRALWDRRSEGSCYRIVLKQRLPTGQSCQLPAIKRQTLGL